MRENWEQRVLYSDLSSSEKVVLLVISREDGFVGVQRVASLAGVNERTVRRTVKKAVADGWLLPPAVEGIGQGWRRYGFKVTP